MVFAREIARHFDFARHFKVIYGSELDGTRTNKVELIAHLLEEERLDPAQTLMIGDRKHDLIAPAAMAWMRRRWAMGLAVLKS